MWKDFIYCNISWYEILYNLNYEFDINILILFLNALLNEKQVAECILYNVIIKQKNKTYKYVYLTIKEIREIHIRLLPNRCGKGRRQGHTSLFFMTN